MRVTCKTCLHEKEGSCALKKSKVRVNKRRACSKFVLDSVKVKEKKHIHSTLRPDWYWDRKKYVKMEKERIKADALLAEQYPLTGNLDSFKSTAV